MPSPSATDLLDEIRQWVEIESHTPDAAGVNAMMDLVGKSYADLGANVTRLPGTDGLGDHLSISSPWGGDGPGILVLCHLDTVHPKGTIKDLPFRIDGDRAYGPGIYDMKGGAFLAFAAFRELLRAGTKTPLPLRLLYVGDEETGSVTSRRHIEAHGETAKYVLVTEPARDGGKIVIGRKGVGRFTMRAHGRPAHSGSRHEEGRSAIAEIARQIIDIEGLTDYARGLTFSIGVVNGGTSENVIPEHCSATIDMRITSAADGEEMGRHILALAPHDKDVELTISGGINRPPFEENDGVRLLFAKARALAKEIGIDLQGVYTGGGSDGNFVAARVPVLDGLGVDGEGAHTMQEHLLISSIMPRMTLQKRLFETLA